MKIITLIENTTEDGRLNYEHGLSLYFEVNGIKYLLDTGQSDKFIENAVTLGIDLKDVDRIVISHNHYDHIGGLKALLEINDKAKVYIKKEAFENCYYKLGQSKKKLSYDKEEFDYFYDRFILIEDGLIFDNYVSLVSVKNPDERFLCQDKDLFKSSSGCLVKDDFKHELFVMIKGGYNTVLSSCSHNGIINIINRVKEIDTNDIGTVIGGLHMMKGEGINCDESLVNLTADYLKENCQGCIFTGHCTGLTAYKMLRNILKDKINYLSTGTVIEIND